MNERSSTDILVADLRAAGAPQFMLRKALAGQYNDYLSDSPHPITDLVCDATMWNLTSIVMAAKGGKYDGTMEELKAWFQREGRHLL